MALVLKEKICLTTPQGVSEVQLLFGDITLLPMTDRVDILFASAFPGDYTPVPGTMMGALKRNLGLSVGNVAKYKELDLRKNFNCWLSKPLPSSMPYGRLVCFERMNRFEPVPEQISGMFRAMMPVFNNEDTTVITPLLATGNQGHSESMVLKSIVRAACHWIKAGLPLRCLKIVVYTRDPEYVSSANAELLNSFSQLKAKWEKSKDEEVSKVQKKFDVCLSFSDGDEGLVGQICSDLLKLHTNVVIHKEQLIYNHEEVWQEKIFDVMVHSHKIVAVLTPKYLDNTECLEQFNLALCCNRLTKAEVLAPFYLQTVDAFPAYMTLIQYTECRVRRDGENAEEKIFSACSMLVCEIQKHKLARLEQASGSGKGLSDREIMTKPVAPSGVYDVFISYAHKSPKEATKMYENLLDLQPDLKVFLDRSELRTGNSWQETLYEAVDKAKVVVAFISKNYLQSTVCMEEYNIALARYMTRDGIYFMPLLTDTDMTEIPVMLAAAPLVDMSNPSQRYEEQYCSLAEAPIRWLEALKMGEPIVNRFCHVKPPKTLLSSVTVKWRERDFEDRFAIIDQSIRLRKPCASDADSQPSSPKTVVFSFAKDSFKEAALLSHFLQQQDKVKISCEFLTSPEDSGVKAPKLQLLDSADMVVVMVSNDYLATIQHLHELHIALCRQRICKDQRVVYLVDVNHTRKKPVYAHLLQYSISLHDELWAYLARRMYVDGDAYSVNVPGSTAPVKIHCSAAEQGALSSAAVDIVDKLMAGKQEGGSGMPTNIVNLVSLMKGEQGTVPVSQCLVPFSSVLADGADNIESLLKSAPDPPAVTPGGDHPEKSPPAQHPVSPSDQNSSSNAQLPGTPDASPGKEDVSKKGPLIQQDVSLSPQAPSSDKDSAGRDAQQGPEAKGGQGKQRVVKVSRACQVS